MIGTHDLERPIGASSIDGLTVGEERAGDVLRLAAWEAKEPRLACGITTERAGDFGVSGAASERVLDRYGGLAETLGFTRVSVPLQVHGSDVAETMPVGGGDRVVVELTGRLDGQIATGPGGLLVSTAADCVPAYLWDRSNDAVGLVHAGWRGVASEILAGALRRMRRRRDDEILVHLGPAICGACYEVDRPVLDALGVEGERALVDLRGLLVRQALEHGVRRADITVSRLCTSCGLESLHSHRGSGGSAGRMAAFLGLRAP